MGPYERSYGSYTPYVHSWPGKAKPKSTHKHNAARVARAKARQA